MAERRALRNSAADAAGLEALRHLEVATSALTAAARTVDGAGEAALRAHRIDALLRASRQIRTVVDAVADDIAPLPRAQRQAWARAPGAC